MKRLPLKTVMNSLRIVTLECGYELHNAAGTAKYDAWGIREEVHGIPEYFPISISLKGPDIPASDTNETSSEKVAEPSLGDLLAMQKAIADQLDHFKDCWGQRLGTSSEGKTPVIMLSDRYTVIGGGYTPEEIKAAVEHIQAIRSGKEFSKAAQEASPFYFKGEQAFIKDAFIGNGITTERSLMKVKRDENSRLYAAGMGITVEDGKGQVAFKAEKFEVTNAAQIVIENAKAITNARIAAAEVKTRLSDDMREAVIDAVRESDLFKALLASRDAQASTIGTTQQAIEQAATNAIRNALKPGGLLFGKR